MRNGERASPCRVPSHGHGVGSWGLAQGSGVGTDRVAGRAPWELLT